MYRTLGQCLELIVLDLPAFFVQPTLIRTDLWAELKQDRSLCVLDCQLPIWLQFGNLYLFKNKKKQTISILKYLMSIIFFRALSNTSGTGKLNVQQFALGLWLCNARLRGATLPRNLPSRLIASIKAGGFAFQHWKSFKKIH